MTVPTLADWLAERPFGLTLSSGFFGFFAHTGVLQVLEQNKLLPVRASGSSAGALISGLWAAGLDSGEIIDKLSAIQRQDFWDPRPGPGLLKGRRFRRLLEDYLPVTDFESSRVPVALSVFDVVKRRTEVVDSGPLAPAIQASCTVPFMFHPVWINNRPYVDGGVLDRPGLNGMPADMPVLYHHLPSRASWRKILRQPDNLPQRTDSALLLFGDLPAVNPYAMHRGILAFEHARDATRHALNQPVRFLS